MEKNEGLSTVVNGLLEVFDNPLTRLRNFQLFLQQLEVNELFPLKDTYLKQEVQMTQEWLSSKWSSSDLTSRCYHIARLWLEAYFQEYQEPLVIDIGTPESIGINRTLKLTMIDDVQYHLEVTMPDGLVCEDEYLPAVPRIAVLALNNRARAAFPTVRSPWGFDKPLAPTDVA